MMVTLSIPPVNPASWVLLLCAGEELAIDTLYGVGVDDFADSNANAIDIRCEDVLKKMPSSYSLKSGLRLEEYKQLHEELPL